jgi:hypothetical protein
VAIRQSRRRRRLDGLDEWLRERFRQHRGDCDVVRRLRNIARKQHGRSGISRGSDNIKWPNAFFVEHALFSLRDAHAQARQSSCR